jgi:copper chaperone
MESQIYIDNLKCGGCANTIRKNLSEIHGVTEVAVFPEKELVSLQHSDELNLDTVKEKLHSLGYPEKGTAEGFDKFSSNIKSYVSCAIGKFSTEEEQKN